MTEMATFFFRPSRKVFHDPAIFESQQDGRWSSYSSSSYNHQDKYEIRICDIVSPNVLDNDRANIIVDILCNGDDATNLNFVDGRIILKVLHMSVRALWCSGQGVEPAKLNPIVQVRIA